MPSFDMINFASCCGNKDYLKIVNISSWKNKLN